MTFHVTTTVVLAEMLQMATPAPDAFFRSRPEVGGGASLHFHRNDTHEVFDGMFQLLNIIWTLFVYM